MTDEPQNIDDAQDQLGSNLSPLDHDGDGRKGGSKSGAESTRAKGAAKRAAKGMPRMTWIVLEENEDIPPTGLPISHNGNACIIRAGEPVQVPDHILNVLDTAVMSSPQIDPTTRQVLGYRERMRFPYRRVDAPAEAE